MKARTWANILQEILVPVYTTTKEACQKHPDAITLPGQRKRVKRVGHRATGKGQPIDWTTAAVRPRAVRVQ